MSTALTAPQSTRESSPNPDAERVLLRYLEPVALQVRVRAAKLYRTATALTQETLTNDDALHLARTAVYFAFLELDGDPEQPTTFDWVGSADALLKKGVTLLKKELMGRESVFADKVKRLSARKNMACVDQYQWTQWDGLHIEPQHKGCGVQTVLPKRISPRYPVGVRSSQDAPDFDQLFAEVRGLLTEQDYRWLVERHCEGVPQEAQVDALVAAEPRYQVPGGRRKAEDYINQRISRARRKLAQRLNPDWREVAAEV